MSVMLCWYSVAISVVVSSVSSVVRLCHEAVTSIRSWSFLVVVTAKRVAK